MSARGRCKACWEANERLNIIQLAHHRGPYFDHWRRQSILAYGGILPDDLQNRK